MNGTLKKKEPGWLQGEVTVFGKTFNKQKVLRIITIVLGLYFIMTMHELGHLYTLKYFGHDGTIKFKLYGMAVRPSLPLHELSIYQSTVVALAGVVVQVILCLLLAPFAKVSYPKLLLILLASPFLVIAGMYKLIQIKWIKRESENVGNIVAIGEIANKDKSTLQILVFLCAVIAGLNILPIAPLDGWKAVYTILITYQPMWIATALEKTTLMIWLLLLSSVMADDLFTILRPIGNRMSAVRAKMEEWEKQIEAELEKDENSDKS